MIDHVRSGALALAGRLAALPSTAWRRRPRNERGDVPGWVLVTLMTAGLVITIWAVAGPRLEEVFNSAIDRVLGGP